MKNIQCNMQSIRDLPIAVIGIMGPYRGGKSSLLNWIIRYLEYVESKFSFWGSRDDEQEQDVIFYIQMRTIP